MAKTRGEIKTLVELHTNRTNDTLEDAMCDAALKLAVLRHPFKDAQSDPDDLTITEDAWTVDISSLNALHIVTARIVDADGDRNAPLVMKDTVWWDKNVINAEDSFKGWPEFGLKRGNTLYLNKPAEDGLELRLRIATIPTFSDLDATECPIEVLDIFVEAYVTAKMFMSKANMDEYLFWKREALGPNYERGIIGGELLNAIKNDKFDIAEIYDFSRDGTVDNGISINNLITGHERYGEVDTWF